MKRLLLLGDSIRMGYMETVKAELAGELDVVWPTENCGHTETILEKLASWLEVEPDLVHLNSGLHDLKRMPEVRPGNFVPITDYEANLRTIFQQITDAGLLLIWCTTTPVITERHRAVKSFDRLAEDVIRYNNVALKVAGEFDLPVHDLYARMMEQGHETMPVLGWISSSHCGAVDVDADQGARRKSIQANRRHRATPSCAAGDRHHVTNYSYQALGKDGVHFTPDARIIQGKAVAAAVRNHLREKQAEG